MTVLHSPGDGTGTSRHRSGTAWVVFDYGEVFSLPVDVRPGMAEMLGVSVPDFCESWASGRHAYDRGQPDLEYWTGVGARLGVRIDEKLAVRLTALDISGWSRVRADAVAVLEELAGRRTPLALLSNAPRSHAQVFRRQPWAAHFRHMLFSGEIRRAKPDADVWGPLLGTLGTQPSELLFFDDRQENVDSARAAGIRAEVWTGAGPARRLLTGLGLLPGPPAAHRG